MEKKTFKVLGMKCHSCAKIIKYGLEEEAGINSASVDFDSAKAYLEFNPAETSPSEIEDKIRDMGYKAVEE